MKKTIVVFSLLIIGLVILFQLGRYSMFYGDLQIELVVAAIAIIFFFVGVYINKKSLHQPKATQKIDQQKIKDLEISNREYEVLKLINKGYSNKEIGEHLYLSESTIKTHVSNLLLKLDAKRRTQAIQIAKDINIL